MDEVVSLALGESLLEARVDANTDPACRSVEVRGWDPWLATMHEATAAEPRTGRAIGLDPAPDLVGAPGARGLVDETVQSVAQAAALAQAELDRRFAGEVVLEGVAAGDPRLQPGTAVELTGVAAPFEGRYVLTAVTHSVDRQEGFRSRIDTTPPSSPMRARGSVTTLGVVTDVDDPDTLGRVRVSLPNYRGIETDWLAVLAPGAGVGKGLVSIPDREDHVLVLLAREDPAQGVVLGGLYGTRGPPDAGVVNSRIRRYTFVTPGGQRLRLDDEKKSVRLETSGGCYTELSPGRARIGDSHGSYVQLTSEQVRVHANTDLELEAPGKTVIIRGAKVDFQEG
jgi:phage baseplate assembly protein gpV